jgi:hypothetical protein
MQQTATRTATSFEFSAKQNETLRVLARRMKFVGVFYIVIGILLGLFALITMIPFASAIYALAAVVQILVGVWTTNAALSFKMIVETSGNDIAYLDNALGSLRKLYNLQFWLLVVMIALFVVGLIIGITSGLIMTSEMS